MEGLEMPLTALDPKTALVVIDLQKGIAAFPTVVPAPEIADKAGRIARAFRARGLPVVLVNVGGFAPGRTDAGPRTFTPPADWLDLLPELDAQPSDVRITKERWGAFHGTALDAELRKRGVTQVVLCGIATSAGVESTARAAYDHGYNVTLVVDAMTDRSAEAHEHATTRIFPRLGETVTTDALLALLEQR